MVLKKKQQKVQQKIKYIKSNELKGIFFNCKGLQGLLTFIKKKRLFVG